MQSYGYDVFNCFVMVIIDVQMILFVYNVQDQCVVKDGLNGQVCFIYVGNQLVIEYGLMGWKSYIWLGGEFVGVVQLNGIIFFVFNDYFGCFEVVMNVLC